VITAAFVILSFAAAGFMIRLLLGPTVPDRVVALDGLLMSLLCGILVGVARTGSTLGIVAVLVVALVGFIATGVVARYVDQRGG
jgi:multicomponent Na+:H+ antiporter subunit F